MKRVMWLLDESPHRFEEPRLHDLAVRWIKVLAEHGWDVSVTTLRRRWSLHEELEQGGVFAGCLHAPEYRSIPIAATRFLRILRSQPTDLVHATSAVPAMISGMSRFGARGPILVYQRSHAGSTGRLRMGSWLAGHLNDFTVAASEAVASCAKIDDRTSPDRVFVVNNGVDPPRVVSEAEVAACRSGLQIPHDVPVICMVARLRPGKGHETLFQAMPLVREALGQTPHVVLIGGGPDEAVIRRSATEASGAVFHVLGHQDDPAPWYDLADVVVMPSYDEAFGLVGVEAMSRGVPLVATRVGGLPEVVGDGGLLVEPRDARALAEGLIRVLRDERLRGHLSQEGIKRYAQGLSVEGRARRMADAYEEMFARRLSPVG